MIDRPPSSKRTVASLDRFHPEIRDWFEARFRTPTDIQERSWPRIAAGEHLLITAPTGSGKTLTAFLWAINAFATGATEPGATRVLYISPLKALNNDIRRNLLEPIGELRERFADAGRAFPQIRVQTRSGDTEQSERQRMLRRPPELLITTPESLLLLLTTVRGRQALGQVECVVLDEIHALVDNRRGAALMACLERLVEVAGEFQRVALSATVRPLAAVAGYIGGRHNGGTPRGVGVIESDDEKAIRFRVRFPEAARMAADNGDPIWAPLSETFREIIDANRSTLFFTNSRRMAEKITLRLNEDAPAPVAWAHHGSLSREIRTEVERRLKAGELKAIVATSSLEMGIDIGDLDEVVLVQSPPAIAAALQRIGRAGHRVGETSRGTLFPSHAFDFLEAAVISGAVAERDMEPLKPLTRALDVLAQVVVSAAATETWDVDRLFAVLTRAAPYHALPRDHFDLVIEMLAGRFAGTRVRDLRPRLAFDRIANTVTARKGAAFALYTSGGTIPDRGYFNLRHADSGAAIGELDEEFVWEASVGDTFTLGTQNWRVHRITHNDVLVTTAPSRATAPPFWRADAFNRSYHFASRVGRFLEHANEVLGHRRDDDFRAELATLGFDEVAASELTDFLKRQREVAGCDLPHANHLLVEHILSAPGGYQGPDREQQVVLHTFWGGRVNRPIALAMEAAWRERFGTAVDVHADNNAIVFQTSGGIDPSVPLSLVTPANFERMLRASLESTAFFGARFRECAGRALLLTRRSFRHRMPLWITRQQSKKLMTAVRGFPDFPILLETWRTCLGDEFDMESAAQALTRLHAGELDCSVATINAPSPFSAHLTFSQVGRYMYADDTPERVLDGADRSALSDELIRQAVFDHSLRPSIDPAVIAEFESKAQRTRPGYVPDGDLELAEWVKERIAIPAREWFDGVPVPEGVQRHTRGGHAWLVHREIRLDLEPRQLATQVLQFYGPRSASELTRLLPFDDVPEMLEALAADSTLVCGELVTGRGEPVYCDADNLETLIRFQRAARRPTLEPRPARLLAPFLATWHGFFHTAEADRERLLDAAERLRGYPAPVAWWIDEAWRPRLGVAAANDGGMAALDAACAEDGLTWRGTGVEAIAIAFAGDGFLLPPRGQLDDGLAGLFRDPRARYTFHQLLDDSGADASSFNAAFWQAVWDGQIAADGIGALVSAERRRFTLGERTGNEARGRRLRARTAALGWPGTWYRVEHDDEPADALERMEVARERCRALLDRYGVIAREIANREGGPFRWAALFPALRVMELGGEVLAGLFFTDLSGPQFALPAAVRQLERLEPRGATYWIGALDPASPCGLGLALEHLPQRRGANHLGYADGDLAIVAEAHARRLTILLEPDDARLDLLLAHLNVIARARRRLRIETVNGVPTPQSPHLPALSRHLDAVRDHRGIYFQPRSA